MPADSSVASRGTPANKKAVALFLSHTGTRALMKSLFSRFSYTSYLKQHDATAAKAYLDNQFAQLIAHLESVPPCFTTAVPEATMLVDAGWARTHAVGVPFFRWEPSVIQEVYAAPTLEAFLGSAGYARMWGLIYFSYVRGVCSELKLDDVMSNDAAETLLQTEKRFAAGDYGGMFGREVQRVWAPQQAVKWAMETIPAVMVDLKDSHRLLAAMLVRIYTGVHSTPELRKVYGNWRPGMAAVPRLAAVLEED